MFATDGTPEGTTQINVPTSGNIYGLASVGDTLIFGLDGQLWATNGTTDGTYHLSTINSSVFGRAIYLVGNLPNELVVHTYDYNTQSTALWKTDGTPEGTELITQSAANPQGDVTTILGDKLIYTAYGTATGAELWVTDGTQAGTMLLRDIAEGSANSWPTVLGVVNGKAIFRAETEALGAELWVTDGTVAGTLLLQDISAGTAGSFPSFVGIFDNKLYFRAETQALGVRTLGHRRHG